MVVVHNGKQNKVEILYKKTFCTKSQVGVCIKLFQRFEVDNSLSVLKAGRFASAFFFNFQRAAMLILVKLDGKL